MPLALEIKEDWMKQEETKEKKIQREEKKLVARWNKETIERYKTENLEWERGSEEDSIEKGWRKLKEMVKGDKWKKR